MRNVFLVGIGGGAGSIARYLIAQLFSGEEGSFPWATMLVNVAGSFTIGLVAGFLATRMNDAVRLALVVGFLGGFTTFSAFSNETVALVRGGAAALGLVNVVLSMLLGVAAAVIGVLVGEALAA